MFNILKVIDFYFFPTRTTFVSQDGIRMTMMIKSEKKAQEEAARNHKVAF
jgi:hypothetical protein